MTLSPVDHGDAVVGFVGFTALCIVEWLNFSLFYRVGNTCHSMSRFFLSLCELLVKKVLHVCALNKTHVYYECFSLVVSMYYSLTEL